MPADPALPWRDTSLSIDPGHIYSLPELIDLAQRNNKETRIAWEQARQAAIGIGIARSALLPDLSLAALGGFQRSAYPFPKILTRKGYITSNAEGVFPEFTVRYLLFDFGSAREKVQQARELSFAANVMFTAAHQRLILDVTQAYFTLENAEGQLAAADQSATNSDLLRNAADDRYRHGVDTVVNAAFAQRGVAQARFEVTGATAAQHNAMQALVTAMGLPPATTLHVVDSLDHPLPRLSSRNVTEMMSNALRQRPDLLAELARLRAADVSVESVRSSFYPKLSIAASVKGNIGQISTNGGPNEGIEQPEAGVYLRLDWPIYQGGLRRNELFLAQSKRDEEEDRLQQRQDQVMREVASANDQLETGLAHYDAAVALETASRTAFNAAHDAYVRGVGSLTDATNAQTALAAARAGLVQAHSQALVDAAALAFSTGNLISNIPSASP